MHSERRTIEGGGGLSRPVLRVCALVLALFLLGPLVPALASELAQQPRSGRLLVKFRPGTTAAAKGKASSAAKGRRLRRMPEIGWDVIAVDDIDRAYQELGNRSEVATVIEDRVRRMASVPDDPRYPTQAHLVPIRAAAAWDVSHAVGIHIAILDTGVDLDHPDLAASIEAGYDFVNDDALADDDHGHGTMVAGIAAARTNNLVGVSGVAWGATIMPIKVLDSSGSGFDSDLAAGIIWAVDHGADVLNLSLGGPGGSSAVDDAIAYATDDIRDAVIVAAAGNSGSPVTSYPASHPDVIGVTSTDASQRITAFSNWSADTDLAAPGVSIVSTARSVGPTEAYASGAGTSFSAPIVAGVAALVRADEPGFTRSQVTAALTGGARDAGPEGFDPYFGHGVVDAVAALGGARQSAIAFTADAHEPNSASISATTLPVGAASSDTIVPEGDVDWFTTVTPGAGTLAYTVTPPDPTTVANADAWLGFDPILDVYDAAGTLVGHVDAEGSGVAETHTLLVPSSMRYYLRVTNYQASRSPGAYVTTAAFNPAAVAPATTVPQPVVTTPPPPPGLVPQPVPSPVDRSGGYWMADGSGAVYAFGSAGWAGNARLAGTAVDIEPTPSQRGYWIVDDAGRVAALGDAVDHGSSGPLAGGERVTALSSTPGGGGYWLFTNQGRVMTFGDAPFLGDMAGTRLNAEVLDSSATPGGGGYYMVAADGGIFTFGDADFRGSMGGVPLNAPVQSLVPAGGGGYWLMASDGGIFAFDAPFYGSMGATRLNRPVTGMVGGSAGYLMVGEDGGIFTFGDVGFYGSLGASPPATPVVSVAVCERGCGR